MGYQIKYDLSGTSKRITPIKRYMCIIGYVTVAICICLIITWSFGGDRAVTVGALENMAVALRHGSSMKDAFETFCLDILRGAQCG